MRRWRFLAAAAAVCGPPAAVASGQTLTEEEALNRLRAGHPQIEALRATVAELAASVRQPTLPANPTVTFTREDAGLGSDDFLLVSQELPLRGRRRLLGEAAARAVTAAESRADDARLAFETQLRFAFTDLLWAQEREQVLEAGVSELRRLVTVLELREREGEGSRFDRLRAEREVADAEADREAASIERLTAQAAVVSFLAPDAPDVLSASGDLAEAGAPLDTVETLVDRALARRADYRALAASEDRWAVERRAADRLGIPTAIVTGGLKRAGLPAARESGYVVGAALALPLFDRGQEQAARAEAARTRAGAERRALRTRIEREVRAAHGAATGYRALNERYRAESVAPAAELVTIAEAAYEEGEYGILELLDAHRVALGARLRLLDLAAAARRAAIELHRAVGGEAGP